MPEHDMNMSTCPVCHEQSVTTWYESDTDSELFRKCGVCGWRGMFIGDRLVALAIA